MAKWAVMWTGGIAVFVILGFLTPDAFAADAWCNVSTTCDTNWDFRKKITIQNGQVSGTSHTDFAVLISLSSDTDLNSSNVQSAGQDIRFTNEDGTAVLSYEIESFSNNITDGSLVAWVKIPTLSGTADTVLYMYYGNSGAGSTANSAAVWTGYDGVWHMNNTVGGAGSIKDSTSNGNDGTPVGTVTSVTGNLGKALDLDSTGGTTDSYIDLGTSITALGTNSFTIIWAGEIDSYDDFGVALFSQGRNFFGVNTGGGLTFQRQGIPFETISATGGSISLDTFFMGAITREGLGAGDTKLFVNGVQNDNGVAIPNIDTGSTTKRISGETPVTTTRKFDGVVDESRIIVGSVLSPDEIKTISNNLNSPSTFYSVSTRDQLFSLDVATVIATGSGSVTIEKLNSNPEASSPSGTIVSSFFDITSSGDLSDRTVILSYSDGDITGVDESSLTISRFSGGVWNALTTTVDTGANTATATTPGFSSFVLCGSGSCSSSASTGGDVVGIPPSYSTSFAENEYPISIDNTKFKLEELEFVVLTTIIETGKPIPVNLLMYDDFGPTYITQVELYTNIHGSFRDVSHSDTSIIYKKGNPLEIIDPNGFFSDVTLTSSIVNQKLQLAYEITFAKEMEKSDIIVQARDIGNNVGVLTVSDAWQVIQAPTEVETTGIPTVELADVSVPGEIKVKTLNVEKPAYSMQEEILIYGTVDGYKFGSAVSIIIRNPSNGFLTFISTFPDKDGYFEARLDTDSKFKTDGTYSATAFADDPNRGTRAIFYFSRDAPPPPPVKTSPVQSIQAEQSTEPELTTTSEPVTQSEPVTPKPRPSFVDLDKDPQSYVDRYNTEPTYKNWFDSNFPDYTIYEAVGLAEPAKEKVPAWIQNNAKWWSEGQIDDGTFVSGIQFLMTKKIIDIPDLPEQASEKARPSFVDPEKDPQSYIDRYNNEASYKEWFDKNHPDYTIEEAVGIPEPIPGWIKNNAKWWVDGKISEDEFVNGLKFLVEKRIIKVN